MPPIFDMLCFYFPLFKIFFTFFKNSTLTHRLFGSVLFHSKYWGVCQYLSVSDFYLIVLWLDNFVWYYFKYIIFSGPELVLSWSLYCVQLRRMCILLQLKYFLNIKFINILTWFLHVCSVNYWERTEV